RPTVLAAAREPGAIRDGRRRRVGGHAGEQQRFVCLRCAWRGARRIRIAEYRRGRGGGLVRTDQSTREVTQAPPKKRVQSFRHPSAPSSTTRERTVSLSATEMT